MLEKAMNENTALAPIVLQSLDVSADDNLLAAMQMQSRADLIDTLLHTVEVLDV